MEFIDSVQQFNIIGGNKNEFSPRKTAMYIGLQMEELAEKLESLPHNGEVLSMIEKIDAMATQFKKGDFDHLAENIDKIAALDADIDIAVVSVGAAHCLGADVKPAFAEVCDSNMSKFVLDLHGNVVALRDANGKIQKGPHYFKPNLSKAFT